MAAKASSSKVAATEEVEEMGRAGDAHPKRWIVFGLGKSLFPLCF